MQVGTCSQKRQVWRILYYNYDVWHRQGMFTEIVVPDVIHEKPLQFGYELCLAYE